MKKIFCLSLFIIVNQFLFATCLKLTSEPAPINAYNDWNKIELVRVYYNTDNHFFPPHFYSPPFNADVKQIDNQDLAAIFDIIHEVLSDYDKNFNKIIDAIYIADSYIIYERSFDVFSLGRNLYIAAYKDGEKVTRATIIEKLHGEIHSIIFDYYPKTINDSNWITQEVFAERYSEDSMKDKTLEDVHSMGFANLAAVKSTKHDFIQYGLWNRVKGPELDSLVEEFTAIGKKHKKYEDIMMAFREKENCPSYEMNSDLNDFYNNHRIEVDVCHYVTDFPRMLTKGGRVTANQISLESSILLLQIIDEVFSGHRHLPLNVILEKIYLKADLKKDDERKNVIRSRNAFFISINESVESSELQIEKNKIVLDLANNLSELIRVNFHWLFPVTEWAQLKNIDKREEIEFFFNEKYNKEILDYFTCEILIRSNHLELLPSGCNDLKKKKLISDFFQKIENWISYVYEDQKNFAIKLKNLEQQYGIDIWWDFNLIHPDFVLPSTFNIQENILYIHAYRTLTLIQEFLDSYPLDFLKRELSNIVMAASMNFVNSNSDIGGTFESSSQTLFLSNFGNDDNFIQGVLHHEFAHLLLSKYKDRFDLGSWLNANPSGFEYSTGGINPDFYHFDSGADYYEQGFVNNHSSTSFDEDFAEFFREYHMNREELKELTKIYDRLQKKYLILESFLGKILYQEN